MSLPRILVLGGTGFIGRHLIAQLCRQGWRVRVPTRRSDRARPLLTLPEVEVAVSDPHDDHALESLAQGVDAVVNLVGILHGRAGTPYGPDFRQAHVALPQRLVALCLRRGIRRLIHLSALGADGPAPLPSMYLRSKADGEQAVMSSELDWTVLRPSVVFGPDDRFLNLFEALLRWTPVVPLARPETRLQPVHVDDLTQAIVHALERPVTYRKAYDIAGPQVYTLRDLVRFAARRSGRLRTVIGLPDMLGRMQAMVLEALPGPTLMSLDNFDSLARDNVAAGPVAAELGIHPRGLSDSGIDPEVRRQSCLDEFRARPRR